MLSNPDLIPNKKRIRIQKADWNAVKHLNKLSYFFKTVYIFSSKLLLLVLDGNYLIFQKWIGELKRDRKPGRKWKFIPPGEEKKVQKLLSEPPAALHVAQEGCGKYQMNKEDIPRMCIFHLI
jgi:hypothetical protein